MKKIDRRDFIKGALGCAGYAAMNHMFGEVVLAQSANFAGKTIITIHLDGGCDWHHSFDIPRTAGNRSAYEQVRPVSNVTASLVLPTLGGHGFHPSLGQGPGGGLHTMYQNGEVRVCRRVGTSSPTRSHGTEQLKLETGDMQSGGSTLGWMGKVLDRAAEQGSVSRFMSIAIGQGNPNDIQGAQLRGLGLRDLSNYSIDRQTSYNDQNYRQYIARRVLNDTAAQTTIVASAKEGQHKMYEAMETLQGASSAFTGRGLNGNVNADAYPTSSPGPQLRQLAMCRQAGLPMQLGLCGMGGYDNHSGIGNETGTMASLMSRLNQAIRAFRNDMVDFGLWNNTVVVVDTEFGRTVQENGSEGTDHGQSMALIVAGGSVNGGVSGAAVSSDEFTRRNGRPNYIAPQYHFANAYEELLAWAGLPRSGVFGEHGSYNFNLV